jgi:cobalt/nickel transport system permease protein
MSHMEMDRYSRLKSPIHDWDPRARIVSILLLIFSIVTLKSLTVAMVGLAVSTGLLLLSRLPLGHVARGLRWPVIFLIPFLIILPFTAGGPKSSFFFLYFSLEGLEMGLIMLVRSLAAVVLIFPMVGSAPFLETALALRDMGLPDALTQIFLFAYRYVFLLNEQLSSMDGSMISKGFVKRSDARTAKVLGAALGMLFIRSYERSERIFQAMASRGYMGRLSHPRRSKMKMNDWLKSFLVIGIALGLQTLQWLMVNL